jgi:hypothetical protein
VAGSAAECIPCGGDWRNYRAPELPGKSRNISVGFRERIGRGAAVLARSLGRKFVVESPAAYGAFQRVTVERGLEIDLHGFIQDARFKDAGSGRLIVTLDAQAQITDDQMQDLEKQLKSRLPFH